MIGFGLTDDLIRSALGAGQQSVEDDDLTELVSTRIRTAPQRRRLALPWLPSPAATMRELQRARLMRVALAAMLMAATVGVIAAGARFLPPPAAPPQWLLLQNGDGFVVPIGGGDRRPIAPLAGLEIVDISTSWDGARLSTIRGRRNEVFEVWDADSVFAQRETTPVRFDLPSDIRVYDAGVWRRDGSGILLAASDHGVTRVLLLDLVSREVSQISPDRMNVDDWQPSPNGQWLEIIGQRDGTYALYVLDLETLELRTVLESDGVEIPVGGALGWAPDSSEMTAYLERGVVDGGIWAIRPDGLGRRRLTPPGQPAWWMNWSPDGAWIMYVSPNANQRCVRTTSSSRLMDTWLVRADGTDAHPIARAALPVQFSDDSRSVLVESQEHRPDAPLGGVIRVFVDGSPAELVYAYTDADRNVDELCHPYGVYTKLYRGNRGGR